MGLLARMSTVMKAKIHKLLDRVEDPRETLEYSYERQLEHLRRVRKGIAEVVTAKKRLELQAAKIRQQEEKLDQQARDALKQGREDLARLALERKHALRAQIEGLDAQIAALEQEQEKLVQSEARLRAKVEAFRTRKEVIKAQYSAAEAQVRIGEAATGLSEELADVALAIERAEAKTEAMRSRAAAIEELTAQGVLDDVLAGGDDVDRQLRQMAHARQVEEDLARLKGELAG